MPLAIGIGIAPELGLRAVGSGVSQRVLLIALITQSDGVGNNPGLGTGGNIVSSDIAPVANGYQWTSASSNGQTVANDTFIQAVEPLNYPQRAPTDASVGYGMPLIRSLCAADPAAIVILVTLAVGGKAYTSDGGSYFTHGGTGDLNDIARVNAAETYIAAHYAGANVERYRIDTPGENDAGAIVNMNDWLALARAEIDGFFSATGWSTKNPVFVQPLMSPDWVGTTAAGNQIQSAKIRLREFYPNCLAIPSPAGPYDPVTGNIHFNADAQASATLPAVCRGFRVASAMPLAKARSTVFSTHIGFADGLAATIWGAYSIWRKLFSAYAGPLFQVKRSSDSTTHDVPFLTSGPSIGMIDLNDLATFVGTDNYTITVIYDQKGSKNLVVSTANPLGFGTGGILRWRDGRPMAGVDSGSNGLLFAGAGPGSTGSMAWAGDFNDSGTVSLFSSRDTGGMNFGRNSATSTYGITPHNSAQTYGIPIAAGRHVVVGDVAGNIWLDGVSTAPTGSIAAVTSTAAANNTILHRQAVLGTVASPAADKISELIIASTVWSSADRTLLHASMVGQYGPDAFA